MAAADLLSRIFLGGATLHQELKMLKKSAERSFQEPEDRAMADVSDSLGVGGTRDRDDIDKAKTE